MRRRRQKRASAALKGNRPAREEKGVASRPDPADARSTVGNQAVERLVERSRQALSVAHGRISVDPAADAAAHLLEAEAATIHGHIIRSRDAPGEASIAGRRLLSHELAHVLQQHSAERLTPEVDEDTSPLEREAERAAAGRTGAITQRTSVPGVQRQPNEGAKQSDVQRSKHPIVEQRLAAYLQRVREAQKSRSVQVTDVVRGDLRRLATADVNTLLRLDAFLSVIGTREPDAMAREIVQLLPDSFDAKRSVYLEALPAEEAPKARTDRGIDLVKRTAPYVSPESQQAQWEFDRRAKEARRNDDVIGPFSLDLQRAWNVGRGLPEVITPTPKKTVPKPLADTTETLVGTLDDTELIPKAARGSAKADDYAIASDVARDVARKLAEAKRRKHDSIEIRLGTNYKQAEDRFEILDALERIVRQVAESMPNEAAAVSEVQVFFGDLPIRRIRLRAVSR